MGTTHSEPTSHVDASRGSISPDGHSHSKSHWPFHAHEKHSKENNSPQAKQVVSKPEEDSGVMTVQKFNVDDDDDFDGPSMMFQKVEKKFSDKAEPKRNPHRNSLEEKAGEARTASKEESKPAISREFSPY